MSTPVLSNRFTWEKSKTMRGRLALKSGSTSCRKIWISLSFNCLGNRLDHYGGCHYRFYPVMGMAQCCIGPPPNSKLLAGSPLQYVYKDAIIPNRMGRTSGRTVLHRAAPGGLGNSPVALSIRRE